MIRETDVNIFESGADILVNTVNCIGVMGKGLALAFKNKYPRMYFAYKEACEEGLVRPGVLHVWEGKALGALFFGNESALGGVTIVNFPTKRHWRDPSRLEDVEAGLVALEAYLRPLGKVKVSVPALGCRNGGLAWPDVRALIFKHLSGLDAEILVHPPVECLQGGTNGSGSAKEG